ncbi:MAG TPA: mannosyltransferase family protein [Candidatus Dormibacteraeota bacterium]|nr:mannosyltransferase family protein [Candidatus Dormibacteraeota bacterium]
MDLKKKLNKIRSILLDLSKFIVQREWLLAIFLTLAIIVISSIIGIENNKIALFNPLPVSRYTAESNNGLSFLANWDGVDYINIAKHGYSSPRLTNFFFLYPVILNLVNKIISSPLISGLIISWSFMLGAVFYYLKIIKLVFKIDDNLEAVRATFLFILFPSAVYLMAVYTESLFAFLSLGAIYYALQRKYLKASFFTTLACVTHINGIFLLILVGLILLEEKEKLRNVLISLVIGSVGLISFMSYLWIRYHNPLEFISAQHDHGWLRHSLFSRLSSFSGVDFILVIITLTAVIY